MDYLQTAMEIVKAQAQTRPMTVSEILAMAHELAAGMKALSAGSAVEAVAAAPESAAPAIDGRKSIKEGSITCCECGKKMKLITQRHLDTHGLTKAEYCAKHGLKKGQSLIAKGISRARKEKMKSMELWKRKGAGKKAADAEGKAAAPAKKVVAKKAAAPAATKKD